MPMFPKPLKPGDHIRVIAPADSLAIVDKGQAGAYVTALATRRLEDMGLSVSFGKNVYECDHFGTSSIESRVADLHDAFEDPSVNGILTVKGGTSSQEILPELDFDLIARNPKLFCGYSDITALHNAIHSQTGLVTYSGPHWSTFGMRDHSQVTRDAFHHAAFTLGTIEWSPSAWFTDDDWFVHQDGREVLPTDGWWVIRRGSSFSPDAAVAAPASSSPVGARVAGGGYACGPAMGSNLTTLALLAGTDFMPMLQGCILFVEVTGSNGAADFRRSLFSVLEQPGGSDINGLVIGRFQTASGVSRTDIEETVAALPQFENIPVIANVDFGHTNPMLTFPVGATAEIRTDVWGGVGAGAGGGDAVSEGGGDAVGEGGACAGSAGAGDSGGVSIRFLRP